MLPIKNSCPVVYYLLLTKLILMCSSFVILSSAEGGDNSLNIFKEGISFHYQYNTGVLLNEKDNVTKSIGFQLHADVIISTVWADEQFQRLLQIQLKSPKLYIRSRKTNLDEFVPHSSPLDEYSNKPFLVLWRNNESNKFFHDKNEPNSLVNLKKAIASLLQVKLTPSGKNDEEVQETDVSGTCTVSYSFPSPLVVMKSKFSCISTDLPLSKHPNPILDTNVVSKRTTIYELDSSETRIKSIIAKEHHHMSINANEELGTFITSKQTLNFVKTEQIPPLVGDFKQIFEQITHSQYIESSLLIKNDKENEENRESFAKTVGKVRDLLQNEHLGSVRQAKVFLQLVKVARQAHKDDVSKTLQSKKNKNVILQLYDVLGYAQTPEIHQIVVKKLHFDREDDLDNCERYLWALSYNSQPEITIIEDLLNKFRNYENVPPKLKETLILTIASMTQKLAKNFKNTASVEKLASQVEETILNELDFAESEDRFTFYRALINLQSKSTVSHLIKSLKTNNSSREIVFIWKTLHSFNTSWWSEPVIQAARRTFLQLDRKYDSSARTLALDVILSTQIRNDNIINELLEYLASNDREYEVKQFLMQRLNMLSDDNVEFRNRLARLIAQNGLINNYSTLAPRGSSTAIKRAFFKGNSSHASLVSIQEMSKGFVKRGSVAVILEKNDQMNEFLNLGIYSGGLSSFLTSDSETNADETTLDNEQISVGMELTVLGTQIRPFVFFTGQGELMGHVWSGTASEKTPAYQALIMLQDHQETLRLSSGFLVKLDVKGGLSFDLSGQVEVSLWNRNLKSLIEKSNGVLTMGSMTIDAGFVRTQLEFTASSEPKLTLRAQSEFASRMMICLIVSQPDTLFRYTVYKIERIPNSKHKIRLARYQNNTIPGRTYYLNRKNNEFCGLILN